MPQLVNGYQVEPDVASTASPGDRLLVDGQPRTVLRRLFTPNPDSDERLITLWFEEEPYVGVRGEEFQTIYRIL